MVLSGRSAESLDGRVGRRSVTRVVDRGRRQRRPGHARPADRRGHASVGPARRRPDLASAVRPPGRSMEHAPTSTGRRRSSRCSSARVRLAREVGAACDRAARSRSCCPRSVRAPIAGLADLQRAAARAGDGRQDPGRRARAARRPGQRAAARAGSAPSGSPSWTRRPATPRPRKASGDRADPAGPLRRAGGVRPRRRRSCSRPASSFVSRRRCCPSTAGCCARSERGPSWRGRFRRPIRHSS